MIVNKLNKKSGKLYSSKFEAKIRRDSPLKEIISNLQDSRFNCSMLK